MFRSTPRSAPLAALLAVALPLLSACGGPAQEEALAAQGSRSLAATCSNAVKDGDETGVDCGGSCNPCPTGQRCSIAGDCLSGVCTSGYCKAPMCSDTVRNGVETDTDCGGVCNTTQGCCTRCAPGRACAAGTDCATGVCTGGLCQAATCGDVVRNGGETDVDCGGPCSPCATGKKCVAATDCQSGNCVSGYCRAPSCTDGIKNGTETGVDCGGSCKACPPATAGCTSGAECASGVCLAGVCQTATCTDAVRNGGETDIDCGGTCPGCVTGKKCVLAADCTSSVCTAGYCTAPSCTDGVKNGLEIATDCGGACPACPTSTPGCLKNSDCFSGVCENGVCVGSSCSDGVRNGGETDVDCGGSACPPCITGKRCATGPDCVSGLCPKGYCTVPSTCANRKLDGDETDVDCGGSCSPCGLLKACTIDLECRSGVCSNNLCADKSCGATAAAAEGSTQPAPRLALSDQPEWDFGNVVAGGSAATKTFTVSFTGSWPVCGLAIGGLASPFHLSSTTCGTTASGSCTITVLHAPQQTGTHTGNLVVTYFDGFGAQSTAVALRSLAVGPAALVVRAGPQSLQGRVHDFGAHALGSSTPQVLTVENLGGAAAMGLSPAGFAAPFPVKSSTCTSTLAAGASCTLTVAFEPTALGPVTAPVSLGYFDGASASASVAFGLSGTGLAPATLTLAEAPQHDFGLVATGTTATKTLAVTYAGEVPATGISFSGLGAPLSVVSDTCGTTTSADCSVTVAFAPTTTGAVAQDLQLSWNDGAAGRSTTRSIAGTGVSDPPTLVSVSPPSGAQGTAVTLAGTNFAPGATVTFDGVAALDVVRASDASITCKAPAHAAGAVDVVVRNPDGQSATLAAGYTYSGVAPVIAAGNAHTCALSGAGGVLCWGNGAQGQLGYQKNNLALYNPNSGLPQTVLDATGSAPVSGVKSLALGTNHSCALRDSGHVYCWGQNSSGQIGNNATMQAALPTQVYGVGAVGYLSDVTAVASSPVANHTCALGADARLYCWGANAQGQLGDNTITTAKTPVVVKSSDGASTLANVAAVGVGDQHSCAALADGSVWCWGYGIYGQLGGAGTTSSRLPKQVKGVGGLNFLADVVAVAGGYNFTCAASGAATGRGVFCWGQGGSGQLGHGSSPSTSTSPVQVKGPGGTGTLGGVAAVVTGYLHACALADGSVWCWGANARGQLGDTTNTNRSSPVQVRGVGGAGYLSGIVRLSAGAYHTCALSESGRGFCWGANGTSAAQSAVAYGQLGHNGVGDSAAPVEVAAQPVAQGNYSGLLSLHGGQGDSVCALRAGGDVRCWGANAYLQLGNATVTPSSPVPVQLPGGGTLTGAGTAAAGTATACATAGGEVWCWGAVGTGGNARGDGTGAGSWAASKVKGPGNLGTLSGITALAGSGHHCALQSGGALYCWGPGGSGQLGNTTMTSYAYPAQVVGVSAGVLGGVTAVTTGYQHTCAVAGGNVFCWGAGADGRLGNNNTVQSNRPVQVLGVGGAGYLAGIASVAAGTNHTCATATGGAVYCWGDGYSGQLGNNGTADALVPVQVLGVGGSGYLANIAETWLGNGRSCARSNDGYVFCWGSGANADGTKSNVPVAVTDVGGVGLLSNIVSLAGGTYHHCALSGDGAVRCWGMNFQQQLGANSFDYNSNTPLRLQDNLFGGTLQL